MISVGIPFYNAENYLKDAIQSVINQSFHDWELILIDDGSKDNSLKIADEFSKKDSRIRVISDGFNKRLPNRLNQLILESKYDIIARMDADDIMHPLRLEKQYNYLKNNLSIDLVSTEIFSIDINNKIIGKREILNPVSLDSLLKGNHQIVHPSIMARRKWYLENLYNEYFDRAEDYELWIRSALAMKLNLFIINEPLLYYREVGNLTEEKLLASYKTSIYILKSYSKEISLFSYLKGILINFLKIIFVKIIFILNQENYLAKRRNKNLYDEEVISNAQDSLKRAIYHD